MLAGILESCSMLPEDVRSAMATNDTLLLEHATRHMHSYDHVLIYEELSALPEYLRCTFGCNVSVPTHSTQVGFATRTTNKSLEAIMDEWSAVIGQRNRLDDELYRDAVRVYRKRQSDLKQRCPATGSMDRLRHLRYRT